MLKNLFRPKWQHKNPAVRKEALQKLDSSNPEHYQTLLEIAQKDNDSEVKQLAVARVSDLSLLKTIAADKSNSAEQAATQRYIDLVSGSVEGLDSKQALLELESCTQQLLFEITISSPVKIIQEQAIILLTQQDYLLQIVINKNNSQMRQLAVAGIVEPDTLKAAINELKTKDKRALQMARNKLKALKDNDRLLTEAIEQQEALCLQIETLAKSSYSPQYSGKYHHLQQQWNAIKTAVDEAIQTRFEKAASSCLRVVEQFQEEEEQRLTDEEQLRQQTAQQESICSNLEQLIAKLCTEEPVSTENIDATIEASKNSWQSISEQQQSHPKEKMRYDKASRLLNDYLSANQQLSKNQESIDKLQEEIAELKGHFSFKQIRGWLKQMDKIASRVNWPEQITKAQQLTSLNDLNKQLHLELNKLEAQQQQIKTTLQQQFKELEKKLESGETDSARQTQAKIRSNIEKLPSHESKGFEQQLHRLHQQLSEFDDWRQYATDPKRLALCEEMEKLLDIDIPLQQKAQAIKDLQQQWKTLGNSQNTQQLWLRFKQAADKAYLPCKQHFQTQAELREHNFQQRQHICDQLKQFEEQIDWQSADWHGVEKIYSVAKQEWRNFNPVDRTKSQPQQKEFNALLDVLNEKLRDERQKNSQAKEQLVEQAKALIEQDDIQDAIEQAKKLQQQWNKIGLTYRKDNQSIWKNFRQACDQIFERRSQEREVEQHESEENLQAAVELCQRIRELASQDDTVLAESQGRFKTLKEEYQQLGPLPKQHYAPTNQQFQDSCEQFQQQFQGIGARVKIKSLSVLQDCALQCETLEALPGDDEQRNILAQSWRKPEQFNDEWWQAIDQRFQNALKSKGNADSNEETLRTLCIRAEILADSETPAHDQQRRMEYQMNRLSAGLGQGKQNNTQQESEALHVEWCCSGPIKPATYPELKKRFMEVTGRL